MQSSKDGLRADLYWQVIQQLFDANHLKNIYIIENYQSGEVFSATVALYIFDVKKTYYQYALDSGKWKLIFTAEMFSDSIKAIFTNKSSYLCNESFSDESVIISHFEGSKVKSKAFFFPCSPDFKKIKQLLSTN